MEASSTGELDASSNTSTATLTYEEGLTEIDSFFSSPPDHHNSDVAVEIDNNVAVNNTDTSGEVVGALAATSTELTQDPANIEDGADSAHDELQLEESDEFATLMADLEEVAEPESASANPKGKLDFILNEATPHAKTATGPSHDVLTSTNPDADGAGGYQSSSAGVNRDEIVATGQTVQQLLEGSQSAIAPEQTTRSPSQTQPTFIPIPLSNLHTEKGLMLLSPRRGVRIDQPESSIPSSPRQHQAQDPPSPAQKVPDNEELPTIADTEDQVPASTLADTVMATEMSPVLPSSEGKDSLMKEMRSEDDDASGSIISRAGLMEQPDLPKGAQNSRIASNSLETSSRDLADSPTKVIDGATLAQQNAKVLVNRTRSKTKLPPTTSAPAGDAETSDEREDAEEGQNEQGAGGEPRPKASKKAAAAKPKKGTKKKTVDAKPSTAAKKPVDGRVTKPTKETTVALMPQRRSTRNQPPVQHNEDGSKEGDRRIDAKTEPAPKLAIPSKRKTKDPPAPPAKRTKQEPHPPAQEPGASAAVAKPVRGRATVSAREQKDLHYAFYTQDAAPGPRKTRAQIAEEEKALPSAGNAAKKRHAKK